MNFSCIASFLLRWVPVSFLTSLPAVLPLQATATPLHHTAAPSRERERCERFLRNKETAAAQQALLDLYNVPGCKEFEDILQTPTGRDVWAPVKLSGRDLQDIAPFEMVTFHGPVDLSHNRIQSLSPSKGAFDGVPALNVSHNQITSLDGMFSQEPTNEQDDAIDKPLVIADFNHIQRPTAITRLQRQAILSMAGNQSARGARYDLVLSTPALVYAALRDHDREALERLISPQASTILGVAGGTPAEVSQNLLHAFDLREHSVLAMNPQSLWYADAGSVIEFTVDGREFYNIREIEASPKATQPAITRWVDRSVQIKGTLAGNGSLVTLEITPNAAAISKPIAVATKDASTPLNRAMQLWTATLSQLPSPSGLEMLDTITDATPSGHFAKIEDHSSDGPWGRSLTLQELVATDLSGWTISSQSDWYGTGSDCTCNSHVECRSADKKNCGYERRQQIVLDQKG